MQNKLRFSAILLTLLFAIMPLTVITANAQTFDLHKPSFGLYCENQNADIHGKVKYAIDENGKAVQYSEYTINGTSDLNIKIPFISNAYELPKIDITVNEKAVTGKICYGENYFFSNGLDFYNSNIDESLTGTLYTLTTAKESLTVNLKTYDKQNFIYFIPCNRFKQSSNGKYSFTVENVQAESTFEIYALNGDFEMIESDADTKKETLTLKDYIDRHYNKLNEYYSNCGNIETEFFYSLANKMLDKNINYYFIDFFIDSIAEQRINAYEIDIPTNAKPCTIAYSMPVDVQKNSTFNPAIYLTEQTATANYNIDYIIELNGNFPYVIESNANVQKQGNYIYTVENVTDDFYFVFSSAQKPKSIYSNNNDTLIIVLCVVFGVIICVLITVIILFVIRQKRAKK